MPLKRTVRATIRPDEESGYVAECEGIFVVTQGETLDEVIRNLKEAVGLYFEGENFEELGYARNPLLIATFEMEVAVA